MIVHRILSRVHLDRQRGGLVLRSDAERDFKAGLMLAALLGAAILCVAATTQVALSRDSSQIIVDLSR